MEDKKFLKKLGKRIEKLRKSAGKSRNELAQACKINRVTVFRIEKGEISTTILVLKKLSEQLGVELDKLVRLD